MEERRFDELTKRLASRPSRRSVLKGIAAGLAGSVASLFGAAGAGAHHTKTHDRVGICHQTGSTTNPYVYIEVSANAVPAHAAHGDAVYVNLQTNVDNCGACGNVCPRDACHRAFCREGQCGTIEVICLEDENPCTTVRCDPVDGCVRVYNTDACETEDGEVGTCTEGVCVPDDGGNQACSTFECGHGPCAERPNASPTHCYCFETVDQADSGRCLGNFYCANVASCSSSADCPSGHTCVTDTCCGLGTQLCAPPCPDPTATSSTTTLNAEDRGPTAGGS